ncbi:FAD-dependent oxidoreductase [Algoriphagus resistens]|uniref:FAD-dependent oxidoreductase n=1 Tax=Algoriphagus resistens TaxID=1750590 RepID=UPI00071682AF|nr:FAD-dependent oxidoreductase [Algoriphagus resistens]
MKRRDVLSTIGALSVGLSTSGVTKGEVLEKPYKTIERELETDILVVGGGTAGSIAAIQAGRTGHNVTLLECQSQLGGTITTAGVAYPGLFFAWGKQVISGVGWELVQSAVELNGDSLPNFSIPHGREHWNHQVRLNASVYALLVEEKCLEAGVNIRYYETPISVEFKENYWHVETIGKGVHAVIKCRQLIDCSGNALAASMAGYDVFKEKVTQPGTLMFKIGGYEFESLDLERLKVAYEMAIDRGELIRGEFRGDIVALLKEKGDNVQHIEGADSTTSETHTVANIKGRESLLKHLRFLKKQPGLGNIRIEEMRTETGVRETYRIEGLYRISYEDYITGKVYPDSIAYSYYPVDLHNTEGVVPEQLTEGIVPTIPFRSMIPKRSKNFIVAGRSICSDQLANSGLRVQASCMAMGQAAGAAAALAIEKNVTPADLVMGDLKTLIEMHGGIIPKGGNSFKG